MNSSNQETSRSLRKLIVGGLITALISAIVGAAVTWYVDRAKPSLTLISVGFRGPINIDTIDVSDSLSTLTTQTGMLPSLKRFESFDKLAATEVKASESLIILQQSIDAVDAWRKRYSLPPQEGQPRRLSAQAVADHPFTSDDLVGGTLTSLIRQGDLPNPPIASAALKKMQPIIPYGEVKKDVWLLVFGRRQSRLSAVELLPDVKEGVELLGLSFAVGSFDNLDYYSSKFIDEARRELEIVRGISDRLREVILPNAVISARLLIENRGGKSVTLNPNFALHFRDKNVQLDPIVLRVTPAREPGKKNPFSLNADGGFRIAIPTGEEEGKKAQVKPFLPDPDSYPYINVPPGEIKEVSVTGSFPLGKFTKDLLTMYQSKLLQFSIAGSTVSGRLLESPNTSFSEKIGEDERKLLQSK